MSLLSIFKLGRAAKAVEVAKIGEGARMVKLLEEANRLRDGIAFGRSVDDAVYAGWMKGLKDAGNAARAGRYEEAEGLLARIREESRVTRGLEQNVGRFTATSDAMTAGLRTEGAAVKYEDDLVFAGTQVAKGLKGAEGSVDLSKFSWEKGFVAHFKMGWGKPSGKFKHGGKTVIRLDDTSLARDHAEVTLGLNSATRQREVTIIDRSGHGTELLIDGDSTRYVTAKGGTATEKVTVQLEPGDKRLVITTGDSKTAVSLSDDVDTAIGLPEGEGPTRAMSVDPSGNALGTDSRFKTHPGVPVDDGTLPWMERVRAAGGRK